MKRIIAHKILRIAIKALGITVLVIFLLPALLYIPPIQNFVKNIATKQVSKATGWDISIDKLLISFPLDIKVDGVLVLDAKRDTMIVAQNFNANVKLIPLLNLNIAINNATLKNGKYRLLSADSSMLLTAKANICKLDNGLLNLKDSKISVDEVFFKGGDIRIHFDNDKAKATPKDTTTSAPWIITARSIKVEKVHYAMQMLPIIDNIDANISSATMQDGLVNIATHEVKVRYIAIDRAKANYFTPSVNYLASYKAKPVVAIDTLTKSSYWTITGDSIRLSNASGLYAQRDARPRNGLDLNYIQANNINIGVDDFYNRGAAIRVPIKHFSGDERCGIKILDVTGVFDMDSTGIRMNNGILKTPLSNISVNANLANGIFSLNPQSKIAIAINANIALGEIAKLYPVYNPIFKTIPQYSNITAKADVNGTLGYLNIKELRAKLPKYATVDIKGHVSSLNDIKRLRGEIILAGNLENINFIKPSILEAKLHPAINFPPLTIAGKASLNGSTYIANMTMKLPTGKAVLDLNINNRTEVFNVYMNLEAFPMHAIMPLGKCGDITASLKAVGKGYNPLKIGNAIDADIVIGNVIYNNQTYRNVVANATIKDNEIQLNAISENEDCNLDLVLRSTFGNDNYNFLLSSSISELDLKSLGLSTSQSEGHFNVAASGEIDLKKSLYDVTININDITWNIPDHSIRTPHIGSTVYSTPDTIALNINNIDLSAGLNASCSLDTLISTLHKASVKAMRQIHGKDFDFNEIQDNLPKMNFEISDNGSNIVRDYLANSNIKYSKFDFNLYNDSTIHLKSRIDNLDFGETMLDTITFVANEQDRSLLYNLHIGNKKGNLDGFSSSTFLGKLRSKYLSIDFTQRDSKQKTRFKIGLNAALTDTATLLHFYPKNPIIDYREWSLNSDNYFEYHYKKHLDANLTLRSDSSYLSIKSNQLDFNQQRGISLKIAGIQISEWLNLSPFAPPIKGVLNTDIMLSYDGKNIGGNGTAGLSELFYNRKRVGNVGFNIGMALDPVSGYTNATANFDINGKKAIAVHGVLNDSTSVNPFNLELDVTSFPLSALNPFIPGGIAELRGAMNGKMNMTGSISTPILNGYLEYDSTHVNIPVFGSKLIMPKTRIPVDSSVIKFNHYNISGSNENPLTLNGSYHILPLDNSYVDFTIIGNNVQFVNSKRTRHSELFGKGYLNINSKIKGHLSRLNINANLDILSGTNITYVLQSSVNSLTKQSTGEIVKFVQFNDSTTFNAIDSTAIANNFGMDIKATLNINQGAILNVNLSPDGKNKVEVEGNGNLTYTQNALGDSRFTGQYTINRGFARYSPPLISEQIFKFESGSSVAWLGDIMNPTLNIKADESIKTNVTPEGENSRMVNFDIKLAVTNSLKNMGIAFDLSTNDDITVHNELQSMTPEQRSNQAMNLILYGSYTGAGIQSSNGIVGNPLYSFLASQLNNWASKNIKGVDLSFGISQYNRTFEGSTNVATNYSYHISKTLLNDRFKIVVGGNYDTDATSEANLAESLINDISFEYLITPSGSMYVKLFRHTGYESILEGEITQMGAGFVLKRKLSTLKDIFKFNLKKKHKPDTTTITDKKK
ncbi:MAG: hypothetical protein RR854_02910 [Muribaculaceae bacterium]